MVDLERGQGPPLGQILSHFHVGFGENWPNYRLAPRLEHFGSTTEYIANREGLARIMRRMNTLSSIRSEKKT